MNYRAKCKCIECNEIYEWWQQKQFFKNGEYFFGCPECNKKYPCPNIDYDEFTLFDDQE